jgi:hypothetical protein
VRCRPRSLTDERQPHRGPTSYPQPRQAAKQSSDRAGSAADPRRRTISDIVVRLAISMAAFSQAAPIRIATLTRASFGIRYPFMGRVRSLGHEADSAWHSPCGRGRRLVAARTTLSVRGMSGRTTMVGHLDIRRGLGRPQEQIALPTVTFGRWRPRPGRNNLAPCRNRAPLFLVD